ncbi:unnamed protein product [Polarella glacialis]|uniref:RZ-type domain-containing protein n=1 Tax=Polarella glacialis TaxID=89957 RepID=A0A813I8S3_POLGL|nr:unnamed protein product [Polarella glacialis]
MGVSCSSSAASRGQDLTNTSTGSLISSYLREGRPGPRQSLHLAEPLELRQRLVILTLTDWPDACAPPPQNWRAELYLLGARSEQDRATQAARPAALPALGRTISACAPEIAAPSFLPPPRLQRSRTVAADASAEQDSMNSSRWELPEAQLRLCDDAGVDGGAGRCHTGVLEVQTLDGLRSLVGEQAALELKCVRPGASDAPGPTDGDAQVLEQFVTSTFVWGPPMPMLIATRSLLPSAVMYGRAAAAIMEEWAERSVHAACYLHLSLLAFFTQQLPAADVGEMLQSLGGATGVSQAVQSPARCLASLAAAGQVVLLAGAPTSPSQPLWDLAMQLVSLLPQSQEGCKEGGHGVAAQGEHPAAAASVRAAAGGATDGSPQIEPKVETLSRWLSAWVKDPVERLSVLQLVLAFFTFPVRSESQSPCPSYRSHRLLPLLRGTSAEHLVRVPSWPSLRGSHRLVGGAIAASTEPSMLLPSHPPTLVRAATVQQRTWKEALRRARQPASSLASLGEEILGSMQSARTDGLALLRLSPPRAEANRLRQAIKVLGEAGPKLEGSREAAAETIHWLAKEDEKQTRRVVISRRLRAAAEGSNAGAASNAMLASVSTLVPSAVELLDLALLVDPQNAEQLHLIASGPGAIFMVENWSKSAADSKDQPMLTQVSSSLIGKNDGFLHDATFGEAACGLCASQDGSCLVADASNHCIRRISPIRGERIRFAVVSTVTGTGATGQRDGSIQNATFSSPCAVLELACGAVVIMEAGHPDTIRVLAETVVMSVPLPAGRRSSQGIRDYAALAPDNRHASAAWISDGCGVCRISRDEVGSSWVVDRILNLKGIAGLSHLWNPDGSLHGLLVSRRTDYRLTFWDLSQSQDGGPGAGTHELVAGQVLSRGWVDGVGTLARLMSPGHHSRLVADGAIVFTDGSSIRKLHMVAECKARAVSMAEEAQDCTELALQRAKVLSVSWAEASAVFSGPCISIVSVQRQLCEANFEAEVSNLGVTTGACFKNSLAVLVLMAPSLASLVKLLATARTTPGSSGRLAANVEEALRARLASYQWPPAGTNEQHQDLEAFEQLISDGLLVPEVILEVLDCEELPRQVACSPQLMRLFNTIGRSHPDHRPLQLAMVRWALRRFTNSSLASALQEAQEDNPGAGDEALELTFAQWLWEVLQPLDLELHSCGETDSSISWLLQEFLQDHLVGDRVDRQVWALRRGPALAAQLGSNLLSAALTVALRSVAARLPLRRSLDELFGVTDSHARAKPFRSLRAELIIAALESALEKQPFFISEKGPEGQTKERSPSDTALRSDLLAWASALQWAKSAGAEVASDTLLGQRLRASLLPAETSLESLGRAIKDGSITVAAVVKLMIGGSPKTAVGSGGGEDGGVGDLNDSNGMGDGPAVFQLFSGDRQTSDALRDLYSRLKEAHATLQGLTTAAKCLWPRDNGMLASLNTAQQRWPDLPARGAMAAIAGEPGAPVLVDQLAPEVLAASRALALLGSSAAFKCVWQSKVSPDQPPSSGTLRRAAEAWAELHAALGTPGSATLRLADLEPVLQALVRPEEIRLLAVTGSTLTIERNDADGERMIRSWAVCDPSATWEAEASKVVEQLWHAAMVRRALPDIRSNLLNFQELFLDEGSGIQESQAMLSLFDQLEVSFSAWSSTAVCGAEEMIKLSEQVDVRFLRHPRQIIAAIHAAGKLLQWLRTMRDDADYLVRVEVALNRSELEVPYELWSTRYGRVDESKISAVTAVRTTLHEIIYRPVDEERFKSLSPLLEKLSAVESCQKVSGLVEALTSAAGLQGPLEELLGGRDAALARLLRMLKPASQAMWIISTSIKRANSRGLGDSYQSEEADEVETRLADERLLRLELRKADGECSQQGLTELLDFQAAVSLSAGVSDEAATQVLLFNDQLGLMRLAASVLDTLQLAGHPEFQQFSRSWPLSSSLIKLRAEVSALRERQLLWSSSLREVRLAYPPLAFFTARQLGVLLRSLAADGRSEVEMLLNVVAKTWRLETTAGSWASELLKCWQANEPSLGSTIEQSEGHLLARLAHALAVTWQTNVSLVIPKVQQQADEFVLGADLVRGGVHVACASQASESLGLLLLPFLTLGRLPAPGEALQCRCDTPMEALQLFLLRWRHSASGGCFGLLLPASSTFLTQQLVAQELHAALNAGDKTPSCPLLLVVVGAKAAQTHIVAQLACHRTEITAPPESVLKEHFLRALALGLESDDSNLASHLVSVHVGPHSGCGKSFNVRSFASEIGAEHRLLRISAQLTAGELSRRLSRATATQRGEGRVVLHIDLAGGASLLSSEAFAALLFELLVLGRLSRHGTSKLEEVFFWEAERVSFAFELPAGVLTAAQGGCLPLLALLPFREAKPAAAHFQATESALRWGMGDSYASSRHDGVRAAGTAANAYQRLQYVCKALALLKHLNGAFPLYFADPHLPDDELPGSVCFDLLVEHAKVQLRPSLWNLWAFVDVLYWQLREVHHPDSVVNQACMPESPSATVVGEVSGLQAPNEKPQDCPMFKGELIAFILKTARDFATRQTSRHDADPEEIVAADLTNFHFDKYCGRWRRAPFSSDGMPVFARYHEYGVGSGQFFLYFRASEARWVIDQEVDKIAPAFAFTKRPEISARWWGMGTWVVNKKMSVRKLTHHLGFEGSAVQVSGVDESLTGKEDEYLVPLNGVYLRQHRTEDVNKAPHYVLEKPRRHLFWDSVTWCIAHVCHAEEGVYARASSVDIFGTYLTMGSDTKLVDPEASVSFVTAAAEAQGSARTAAQQEADGNDVLDDDFPLLRWEDSSHDCMLFSNRRHAVCFLSSNPAQLQRSMHPGLLQLLEKNGVRIGESLDALTADHTHVLGCLTNVDHTAKEAAGLLGGHYCLTGDAVLKMLAVFVRMRCGLPVVLMGECGCGKTELVRYLCAWLGVKLLTLNVHGGTTEADIDAIFAEARQLADRHAGNAQERVVVFLDEINTSHHVSMLCEAVLSRSLKGELLPDNLDVLAALNPRRRRPPQMQLTTGLVYSNATHGGAEEEMSSLVYRVHAVPQTVHDFLFDFGALTKHAETAYVRSMVLASWPACHERELMIVAGLSCLAQGFIRQEEGDASAVSLRDVKRSLRVALWMQQRFAPKAAANQPHAPSVIVAVALVYNYRLPHREQRRKLWNMLARCAPWPSDQGAMKGRGWAQLSIDKEANGLTAMENLVLKVQTKVASEFELDRDVVMNEALAENVFVGLLCIMNRIPLFIVGKPGTSKTLCVQVLLSNLQGNQSKSKVLRGLPAIRVMQFQCSPLSTADGIERQFEAAGRFADSALDAQVVLLLDEVGLAEFSPDMPLKVLHGILADPGKVAVVGLSNWRLDPAKMNRSVCLARPDPDSAEVIRTGAGLLASVSSATAVSPTWLSELAAAFWKVFADQGSRDWLGMRDYYSFVRSICQAVVPNASCDSPSALSLANAVRRNFGGRPDLLDRLLDSMLQDEDPCAEKHAQQSRPGTSLTELLRVSLFDRSSRHLLLVSKGPTPAWLSAMGLLPQSAEALFGSDFPDDDSEAYAIRQLTKVRKAMAEGRVLVLSGMDVIYEALYDVLNQRYVRRQSEDGTVERMLRLAIGSRSQLCNVADGFKLVVLVDTDHAQTKLDVPFLNRFEKQLVEPEELLPDDSREAFRRLRDWADKASQEAGCQVIPGGLDNLSLASLVLSKPGVSDEELRLAVLCMAVPLAVFRSQTLQDLKLKQGGNYFSQRSSLSAAIRTMISSSDGRSLLCDICTSSPCAHLPDESNLAAVLGYAVQVLPLAQLSGDQQLQEALHMFLSADAEGQNSQGAKYEGRAILILQVDALACSDSRLALTRHCCEESLREAVARGSGSALLAGRHVFLIHHRAGWPAPAGLKSGGFAWRPQVGWSSIFVDDLRPEQTKLHDEKEKEQDRGPSLEYVLCCSVHQLLLEGLIPKLRSLALERCRTCLARCLQPLPNEPLAPETETVGHKLTAFSERLASLRTALQHDSVFAQAWESAAMHALQLWAVPDVRGLHLHVSLAMNELRTGSLRCSVALAIDRLCLAALSHALRWLDMDFNLTHLTGTSQFTKNLWHALAACPAVLTAPQLSAALLAPGAAMLGPAEVPNNGRHGLLACKCPFSARLLSILGAARVAVGELQDSKRLRALCCALIGEEATSAFDACEAAEPGFLLHDAVAILSPTYPHLDFGLLLQAYASAYKDQLGDQPARSPLEVLAALWRTSGQLQSLCSLLSLLARVEPNSASRLLEKAAAAAGNSIGGLSGAVVAVAAATIAAMPGAAALAIAAKPHIRMLLCGAASNGTSLGQTWWRLQVVLVADEELTRGLGRAHCAEGLDSSLVPEWRAGEPPLQTLLGIGMWEQLSQRICATMTSAGLAKKAPSVAASTFQRGLVEIVSEVIGAGDSNQELGVGRDLVAAIWAVALRQPGAAQRFGLEEPLTPRVCRGLLAWLRANHFSSASWAACPRLQPECAWHLLNFVEDVETVGSCGSVDFEAMMPGNFNANGEDLSEEFVHMVARVRAELALYAARLVCGYGNETASRSILQLLQGSKLAAIFVTKVARKLGGDEQLCRIASQGLDSGKKIIWFPVDPSRLPALGQMQLPDPFVTFVPSHWPAEWYLSVCSAASLCATTSSPTLKDFNTEVEQTRTPADAGKKRLAVAVLGCIVSRVLLHRVAFPAGLDVLQSWTVSKFGGSSGTASLIHRLFAIDTLLPHLQEVANGRLGPSSSANSPVLQPTAGFLEQLAGHIVLTSLDLGEGWLQTVLLRPREAQLTYWPAMPESEESAVMGALGFVGWYVCPRGHPYSVGECTRPMQLGVCPVAGCGCPIGGQGHVDVQGVRKVDQQDFTRGKSQTGYVAVSSELIDQTIVNQGSRPLSASALKALRLVLHTALWISLGSEGSHWAAAAIMPGSSGVSAEAAAKELLIRISEDWAALLLQTGLTARELGAWVHLTLTECASKLQGRWSLDTEQHRKTFESAFQTASEAALRSVNSQSKERLRMDVGQDFTATLRSAMTAADWSELCDVDETASKKNPRQTVQDASLKMQRAMWRGRLKAGLGEFERFFFARRRNSTDCPLIAVVVKHKKRLAALPALPALLSWHALLFEALEDGEITREQARQITNQEAIQRLPEHRRQHATAVLASFCNSFNMAFPLVENLFECQANPFLRDGKVHLPGPMSPEMDGMGGRRRGTARRRRYRATAYATEDRRAPLGPMVGGAAAAGAAQRQSVPTQPQLDWIATLALQRGLNPEDVLAAARTKAEASALIDQLRAPPR